MSDPLQILREAKLKALQDTLGNYGSFQFHVDFDDEDAATPVSIFTEHIKNAKNIADIKKQLELWNLYKPLSSVSSGRDYVRYFTNGFGEYQGSNAPYGGSRPVFPTTDGSNTVQTTAGGAQGVVTGGGTQGTQTGGTGTPSAKGGQTGNTGGTSGTYASTGVPRGGTKTIGYDPNPGNVSLAYTLRNAPEQERRAALIDKWNAANGISYVTGKDGLIYRRDPQHPNGYVDPFKNDLSKTGSTYASPSISTGGTYATGEGIKDANGNVLTNPGGNWEYQYALKNPQYGLGMMGKMSDAQRNYLQAVSDNMGYNYNFTGATRFV